MSDRTPVLHLIESDGVYGAEQVVLNLARHASGDERFPAAIGCLVKNVGRAHPLYERARALGLPAHKLLLRNRQSPYDLFQLSLSLRRLGIGLIHAHGYKGTIAGYATHRWTHIPALVTCHSWIQPSQPRWTYRSLTYVERNLYRRFPHVVAVSAALSTRLRERGVSPDRLTVIPNGIEFARSTRTPPQLAALRQQVGADAESFLLLHCGRLAEEKAQTDLIAAAAQLFPTHPHLRVLILGDGPLRPALEQQIEASGLGNCVRILGFRENVADYLAIADAFVLTSLTEGLPMSLLEALAARLPVICTPVGELPQLLEDGLTAFFVPVHAPDALAQTLSRLIADPELRRSTALRGQQIALEGYGSELMYRRYREVYGRLVPTRPHSG